jgi:outer membrane receptor protein involved in Fe transport
MTTRRRSFAGFIVAFAVAAASFPARADDSSELDRLLEENIVTTASKAAETETTAPATSSTLTAEDIQRYGIHSLAEAINYLSLGAITFDPLFTAEIGARGVFLKGDQGNHFLLLVDGHAVNEPLAGSARFDRGLGVPIELVDHIEVILGPGSVLYGSNAMLGVINVVTKRAKYWNGVHLNGEAEFGKSARASAGAGTTFKLFSLPSELTVAVEYYQQKGPAFTFEPQPYGAFDPFSGMPYRTGRVGAPTGVWGGTAYDAYHSEVPAGQLRLSVGPFELSAHASTFTHAAPYASYTINRDSDFDDPESRTIDRSLWFDLKHRATLSQAVELQTRAYVDSFDSRTITDVSRVSGCLYPGTLTCSYRSTGASQWGGLEVEATIDWLKTGNLVTLVGLDGRLREVKFQQDVFDYDTGAPLRDTHAIIRANDATLGAFLQQTMRPVKPLSINAGARYDFDSRFSPVLSPRLAASLNLWPGGTVKAVYAEAFRAPSFMETSLATDDILLADALTPERVRSFELSVDERFGSQRISLGGFRSSWLNLVELHALTHDELDAAAAQGKLDLFKNIVWSQYQNVASIDDIGFTGTYDGSLLEGSLRYGLNVTGSVARRNDRSGTERPVEVAPRFFGNARVLYDLPGDWPAVGVAAQFKSGALTDRSLDGGWPQMPTAPGQLELRATLSGPFPMWRMLSYRFSADYAFADRTPYVVGPHQVYYTNNHAFDTWYLAPVDTFRITGGLQMDWSP